MDRKNLKMYLKALNKSGSKNVTPTRKNQDKIIKLANEVQNGTIKRNMNKFKKNQDKTKVGRVIKYIETQSMRNKRLQGAYNVANTYDTLVQELKNKGASQREIYDFTQKKLKAEDIQNELRYLKQFNPPLYQTKLKELEYLSVQNPLNNTIANLQLQNSELRDLVLKTNQGIQTTSSSLKKVLTPKQLLQISIPDYDKLTSKQRESLLKKIQKTSFRNIQGQQSIIEHFASLPEDRQKGILDEFFPPIAGVHEIKYSLDEVQKTVKQMFENEISNTHWDSNNERDYVVGVIMNHLTSLDEEKLNRTTKKTIEKLIDKYKNKYENDGPSVTNMLINGAQKAAIEKEKEEEKIEEIVDGVAKKVAETEVLDAPVHPIVELVIPTAQVADQYAKIMETTTEESEKDIEEAKQEVTKDLEELPELIPATPPRAPTPQLIPGTPPRAPTPPPTQLNYQQAKSLAQTHNVDINDINGKGSVKKILERVNKALAVKSQATPTQQPQVIVPVPTPATPGKGPTNGQIKEMLDALGVKYKGNDNKATLTELLTKAEEQVQEDAQEPKYRYLPVNAYEDYIASLSQPATQAPVQTERWESQPDDMTGEGFKKLHHFIAGSFNHHIHKIAQKRRIKQIQKFNALNHIDPNNQLYKDRLVQHYLDMGRGKGGGFMDTLKDKLGSLSMWLFKRTPSGEYLNNYKNKHF